VPVFRLASRKQKVAIVAAETSRRTRMIIAKSIWVNVCALVVVAIALTLAEYFDAFLIPVLLILSLGIFLAFTRCRRCGHFLIFWGYVLVVPWIPKTCPKCGKTNPLTPENHEEK